MKLAHLAWACRWPCCLLLMLAVLLLLPVGPARADAADPPLVAAEASSALVGNFLQDVVGNRTRLIQASIIFVLLGIALLWKK